MKPTIGSDGSAGSILMVLAVFTVLLAVAGCSEAKRTRAEDVFQVKRGNLDITVVESGSLEAAESLNVVSRVRRALKIVEIVDEGTNISEEDVKNGKVLVRLEADELKDQLYERESQFESAKASLTEAQEGLLIQKSDNASSIRSAELDGTFAMNDLRKLVGETLAEKYLTDSPEKIGTLLVEPEIGGQALQDLRMYQSAIELAKVELGQAREKLKYTRKLYDKEYVSKNELENDILGGRKRELDLETAEGKLDIFRRYEFVKNFQKTWSTMLETREKLERARAVARSRLAQAKAKLSSRQAGFQRSKTRLDSLKEDIENCTIKATKPGFVVYKAPPRWRNNGPIQAGSEIRPKETIIELPDLSAMVVKVNINEAQIDTVTVGQGGTIKIDAIPNRVFTGKVNKKAVLPSSQSRWLNPDLKVYETRIAIVEKDGALRPGMTATVEILAERVQEVLFVPIQAVQTDENGDHYCYLADGTKTAVKIDKRNQIFVVISEGLAEGSTILMSPPELTQEAK